MRKGRHDVEVCTVRDASVEKCEMTVTKSRRDVDFYASVTSKHFVGKSNMRTHTIGCPQVLSNIK